MSKLFSLSVLAVGALSLAGCGDSGQQAAAPQGPPPPRGIFMSSSDCAEAGHLTADECGQAIDIAVAAHERDAPTFRTLHQCVTANGPERCDKTVDGSYRARLEAFFVVMSHPPRAVPLYPSTNGAIGFRSPSKQFVSIARDEGVIISASAQTAAHDNAKLPILEVENADGLGAAAADIH